VAAAGRAGAPPQRGGGGGGGGGDAAADGPRSNLDDSGADAATVASTAAAMSRGEETGMVRHPPSWPRPSRGGAPGASGGPRWLSGTLAPRRQTRQRPRGTCHIQSTFQVRLVVRFSGKSWKIVATTERRAKREKKICQL